MNKKIEKLKQKKLTQREKRLLSEWEAIDRRIENDNEIKYIVKKNQNELPVQYEIIYDIHSICGVEEKADGLKHPVFADQFKMKIVISNNYPAAFDPPVFSFLLEAGEGSNKKEIAHPWHPNINYISGRVCLNHKDAGPFVTLAWHINRVAEYLRYNLYLAQDTELDHPEDIAVAEWILTQAEPNNWLNFNKKETKASISIK